MRHSKHNSKFTSYFWHSALSSKQWKCMWVTFYWVKGQKYSSGHALTDKFPNGKQLCRWKEWGVGTKQWPYLEEHNCSMNGRPVSISHVYLKSLWTIGYPSQFDIIEVLLWIQELHCSKLCARSQQLTASKDIPSVFLLPSMALSSQLYRSPIYK